MCPTRGGAGGFSGVGRPVWEGGHDREHTRYKCDRGSGRPHPGREFDATERNRRFLKYIIEETIGVGDTRLRQNPWPERLSLRLVGQSSCQPRLPIFDAALESFAFTSCAGGTAVVYGNILSGDQSPGSNSASIHPTAARSGMSRADGSARFCKERPGWFGSRPCCLERRRPREAQAKRDDVATRPWRLQERAGEPSGAGQVKRHARGTAFETFIGLLGSSESRKPGRTQDEVQVDL
jgi:hypothetical protein